MTVSVALPKTGTSRAKVKEMLTEVQRGDEDWMDGKVWNALYYAGDDIVEVCLDAYEMYFEANGNNHRMFPSLKKFEEECSSMAAGLLHGDDAMGSWTSCGSESLFMAVKTARDRGKAEHPTIEHPEIVMPQSAHHMFDKAAALLEVKPVRTPVNSDGRADMDGLRSAITDNTVLIVGSAPNMRPSVIDPIPEMGQLALERSINLHVDACLGGFVMPFVEKLGYPVPPWDFRVPGVATISADLHKYGYAAKGASLLMLRDAEMYQHLLITYMTPRGTAARNPNMQGTRPGGIIAAAWAVLNYLGEEGYLRLTQTCMDIRERMMTGIKELGFEICGDPPGPLFAYSSSTMDMLAIAEAMNALGWRLNAADTPPVIPHWIRPINEPVVDEYLRDLARVVDAQA